MEIHCSATSFASRSGAIAGEHFGVDGDDRFGVAVSSMEVRNAVFAAGEEDDDAV